MGKGRAPCCDKSKVRTGPWSTAEDLRLTNFIQKNGHTNWRALPKQAGLLRCGKSCRLRWVNYLSPDVKRGNFSPEEEQTIIDMHTSIGNKWSKIASRLPGRTDNEIKNVWNTHLKKRVVMMKKNIQGKPYSENIIHMASSSASSPCSSSNSTTSTGDHHDHDQNMEELLIVSGVQDDRVKKPDGKPESLHELISTSDRNNDDKSDQLVEIPSDIDDDLWELLNSLDPLQFNKTAETNINEEKLFDGEIAAVSEWLRILENNEDGDQINGVSGSTATNSICHEMNLDYSSIWP